VLSTRPRRCLWRASAWSSTLVSTPRIALKRSCPRRVQFSTTFCLAIFIVSRSFLLTSVSLSRLVRALARIWAFFAYKFVARDERVETYSETATASWQRVALSCEGKEMARAEVGHSLFFPSCQGRQSAHRKPTGLRPSEITWPPNQPPILKSLSPGLPKNPQQAGRLACIEIFLCKEGWKSRMQWGRYGRAVRR
jgi:hypothetical protein